MRLENKFAADMHASILREEARKIKKAEEQQRSVEKFNTWL